MSITPTSNSTLNFIDAFTLSEKTNLNISILSLRDLDDFQLGSSNIPDLIMIPIYQYNDITRILEQEQLKDVKTAIILPNLNMKDIIRLYEFDIDGYFVKNMSLNEIISGIRFINEGCIYVYPELAKELHDEFLTLSSTLQSRPEGLLTKREWDVLLEISRGNNNEIIAKNLEISDKTVKNHVTTVLRKLNVNDRTNAMLLAYRKGWI
ncbi:response regulator transcription factor [Oceanobacillus jeddahense]|uniref:Response regulator transcription factor n=1 Tax=Oceanobacillus jeddahense TaxID=1462527 RepID=A0ABY5JWP7_9BACI|nr:response regulator transcription factor [Oceanobacillus jeddahense]UUI04665.1 response regulator transcription factor [Oceanobacillus jeddahense]